MTPDEVLEALKAIIMQKLGLLTRQEQLTVLNGLSKWLPDHARDVWIELLFKPADPTE